MLNENTQSEKTFQSVIRDRHSIRAYDPNFQISEAELKEIIAEATTAPSSSNMQSWRFLVITDQKVKEQLYPVAYNQQPILDSSAVIIILGDKDAYTNAEKIYGEGVRRGYTAEEDKIRLVNNIMQTYPNASDEKRKDIALVDGGLVAMQLMLVAKSKGYDTVPMGGYDANKLVELFQISDRYVPVMLLPIGKATKEPFKTTRLPLEDIVFWNGLK